MFIKKIEKYTFYLLLFCIPFGTRKLVFNFFDIGAIGSEFTSFYLYLTDLLIFLILVLAVWRWQKGSDLDERQVFFSVEVFMFLFLLVAGLSLLKTAFPILGAVRIAELSLFFLLFFYVKKSLHQYDIERLAKIFIASALFQSILGAAQYFTQSDLGLRVLGESPLGANIAGVAKFSVKGSKIIRAYGTLPHPNVLSCFLVVAFFVLSGLYFYKSNRKKLSLLQRGVYLAAGFILLWGVGFTFSRAVILGGGVALGGLFLWLYRESGLERYEVLKFGAVMLLAVLFFSVLFLPQIKARLTFSLQDQAISLRAFYNRSAWESLKSNPLLGVGMGSFVPFLSSQPIPPWKLQPAHNVYLLVASETGFLGVLFFFLFLTSLLLRLLLNKKGQARAFGFFVVFFLFFVMGVDHFLWTIQQGQLIFWLVVGGILFETKEGLGGQKD